MLNGMDPKTSHSLSHVALTLSAAGQLLGQKGGLTTARALTADQRRARARKAAAARWAKQQPTGKDTQE